MSTSPQRPEIPVFDRAFLTSGQVASRIGEGEIGGKAHGLVQAHLVLSAPGTGGDVIAAGSGALDVTIPIFVVLATDVFEEFVERNDLGHLATTGERDDRIAHAFQNAALPAEIVGDLRTLIGELKTPLAVRSSSLLEDALAHPFAGVYETKMTPNNQLDPEIRFQKLVEAIKLVYASTYFQAARDYAAAIGRDLRDERMAVVIQEVLGLRHEERYYPDVSGVCRSYNFYPTGDAPREDGVVSLALGLGKTIVDGGVCYSYSPSRPDVTPPYASPGDALRSTQREFWAVNVGAPPPYDPIAETEYMVRADLSVAEYDGTLSHVASTYVPSSDRIMPGVGRDGPRVLDFSPLLRLETLPLNRVLRALLDTCERTVGQPVEIEFALAVPPPAPGRTRTAPPPPPRPRFGCLQVRPMLVAEETIEITEAERARPDLLAISRHVMGNGWREDLRDVVYVRPERFEARLTRRIAGELEQLNRALAEQRRPYLLIGFGRWGSSDPWLGIPVAWGQISGARAIIEASLPTMMIEPSQGSHFFHNLSSFRASYFTISHTDARGIDWRWLDAHPGDGGTELVRHIELASPLTIKVDGRRGLGAIWYGQSGNARPAPREGGA
ncbi:MAG: PEP/pyruvate-binding domain-containing protein [Candidatus Eiseniibacteriota bacterium]|jgi:hypothetical protein